jgi:hypothetical protein
LTRFAKSSVTEEVTHHYYWISPADFQATHRIAHLEQYRYAPRH